MRKQCSLTVLASCAMIVACGGESLNVGSNSGSINPAKGSGGTGGTPGVPNVGAPPPTWPEADECVVVSQPAVVGTWDGYIETGSAIPFPKGAGEFRMTIAGANAAGKLCGTVVYGEGTPPPPATDPDAPYPPAASGYPPPSEGYAGGPGSWGPMQGVAYTMLDATSESTSESTRVRFNTALSELWRGWCALQTPFPNSSGSYGFNCIPNGLLQGNPSGCSVIDPLTEVESQFDCRKVQLCVGGTCSCNSSQCEASRESSSLNPAIDFDVQFAGNMGAGSMRGGYRVRLTRVE